MHQTQQMLSPRQAIFHQHEQKLVIHCYFEAEVRKSSILLAFPAFLIKNQRKSCVLPAFPAFLIKNRQKHCVLQAFIDFDEI